ncbi:MAG: cell division protein SepF [Nanoarchaeota archaeon]|nr:cell division protein SepF [Nanoarchaeota archaeon]
MVFDAIKRAFSKSLGSEDSGEDYLEIDLGKEEADQKVFVKLFTLKDYEEVNNILNSLREGYTIAVVDIGTLRRKDPIELKRAVSKIKKTSDAMEGNIAGFGENTIIITPSFARIHKEAMPKPKDEKSDFTSRWD